MPGPSIRRAGLGDAVGLALVNTTVWREAYAGLMGDEFLSRWQVSPERWRQRLRGADPRFCVLVAIDDGRIVGFTAAGPSIDSSQLGPVEGEVAHLYSLYVLAKYYGRGLGYQLHEAQLDAMNQRGFSSAMLWVLEGNSRAITFYRRQGWVHDGTTRREDLDGEVLMEHRYRRPNLATA